MIKDIINIEGVQHRATRYILKEYNSNYKARLIQLQLIPVMNFKAWYLLLHLLIILCSYPIKNFNIKNCNIQSKPCALDLLQVTNLNIQCTQTTWTDILIFINFLIYIECLARINLLVTTIKTKLKIHIIIYENIYWNTLMRINTAHTILYVHVADVNS